MHILITGSEGLIGSSLAKKLESKNIHVKGYDIRLQDKSSKNNSYDVCNAEALRKAASDCDGIVHLAAVSRVIWGEKDPDLCWEVNEGGTTNVLKAAWNSPKKPWVLYGSSREVYGQQKVLPVKETALLRPMNVYADTKVAAENAMDKARESGLQTSIVRFSNVYGSLDDHPDRVIPAFCKAAAFGNDLRIDGSENTFDFTHIDDVTDGLMIVIEKLIGGGKNLPPIHFTTGQPCTLLEAAKIACKAGGNRSNIVEAPSRSFDVGRFYGDTSLAHELLGWKAKVFYEEGIKRFIELFKQQGN